MSKAVDVLRHQLGEYPEAEDVCKEHDALVSALFEIRDGVPEYVHAQAIAEHTLINLGIEEPPAETPPIDTPESGNG